MPSGVCVALEMLAQQSLLCVTSVSLTYGTMVILLLRESDADAYLCFARLSLISLF